MSRQVFLYDPPERFVAGTVGLPGRRTFFLQASAAGRTTSVALEKAQVEALAERIDELLDEVVRRSGGKTSVPAVAPAELEGAFAEGIGFDGSAIEGFARVYESDMLAKPDPATFQILPWRGEGPSTPGGSGKGDLRYRFVIDVPNDLSAEQKKAVEELSKVMNRNPRERILREAGRS